jgi:hypothetical protein
MITLRNATLAIVAESLSRGGERVLQTCIPPDAGRKLPFMAPDYSGLM